MKDRENTLTFVVCSDEALIYTNLFLASEKNSERDLLATRFAANTPGLLFVLVIVANVLTCF